MSKITYYIFVEGAKEDCVVAKIRLKTENKMVDEGNKKM